MNPSTEIFVRVLEEPGLGVEPDPLTSLKMKSGKINHLHIDLEEFSKLARFSKSKAGRWIGCLASCLPAVVPSKSQSKSK